jgi:hypothetical protein
MCGIAQEMQSRFAVSAFAVRPLAEQLPQSNLVYHLQQFKLRVAPFPSAFLTSFALIATAVCSVQLN